MNRITNAGGFVNAVGRINGNLNLSRYVVLLCGGSGGLSRMVSMRRHMSAALDVIWCSCCVCASTVMSESVSLCPSP